MPNTKFTYFFYFLGIVLLLFVLLLKNSNGSQICIEQMAYFLAMQSQENTQLSQDFLAEYVNNQPFDEHFLLSKITAYVCEIAAPTTVMFSLFVLLLLSTLIAMIGLASVFLKSIYLRFGAVALFLYYFSASIIENQHWFSLEIRGIHFAHLFGVGSLYFFFQKKWGGTLIFCVLMSLFHPTSGFVLGLVEILTALCFTFQFHHLKPEKDIFRLVPIQNIRNLRFFFLILLLFSLIGNFWLEAQMGYVPTTEINSLLFSHIFQFQRPEHYLISHFSLYQLLISLILSTLAFAYFRTLHLQHEISIGIFFVLIGFFGCVVTAIGSQVFENYFITHLQWYSIYDYLRFLGLIAALCFVEHLIERFAGKYGRFFAQPITWTQIAVLSVSNGIAFYYYQKQAPNINDEIAICHKANELTPTQALFAYPAEIKNFIPMAKRAAYLHFFCEIYQPQIVKHWAERVQTLHQVSPEKQPFAKTLQLKENYKFTTNQQILALYEKGITHFITFASENPQHARLLAANQTYKLYQIIP
ncbi:MAG: hypothetical protein ACKVTZ_01470 [Bacteroidia bacterium]